MKILVTGPECSGKTTISNWISRQYDIGLCIEMARPYLQSRKGKYDYDSLHEMALLQQFEQNRICNAFVDWVCDTDLMTIIIWSKEVFGKSNDIWHQMWLDTSDYDVILLCKPDIPWEYDVLRENPNDRDRLYDVYAKFLNDNNKVFIVLEGQLNQRKMVVEKNLTIKKKGAQI
jgi:nicotinamide riboside kinase